MDCSETLVRTAQSQLGTTAPMGAEQYISWYNKSMGTNLSMSVSWCAIFVSWCARQAGTCTKVIPNYASCTQAMLTFQKMGIWKKGTSYTPGRGDLIFFDWNRDPSVSEHTGIVTGVDGAYVHTVEGNSGAPGAVRAKQYLLQSSLILGYAAWAGEVPAETGDPINTAQRALNEKYQAALTVDGDWGAASRKAAVKAVQQEINNGYHKRLAVDGSFGPASRAECPTLKLGDKNGLVWVLQLLLTVKGYALELDSSYGPATEAAVRIFNKSDGRISDATAGSVVFAALLN